MNKVNKIQAYFLQIQIHLEGIVYLLCILSMYYSHYSSIPSLRVSYLEKQFAKSHFSTQLWFFKASENNLSINQRCTESGIKQKSVLGWKSSIQRKQIFKNLEKYDFSYLKWLGNEKVSNFQGRVVSSRNLRELYSPVILLFIKTIMRIIKCSICNYI